MKTIYFTVSESGVITATESALGRTGENECTIFDIDVSQWHPFSPSPTFLSMNYEREADKAAWTVFAGRVPDESGHVTYIVESLLVAQIGIVSIQFEASFEGARCRSKKYNMRVFESIQPTTPPTDDFPSWHEGMLETANVLGLVLSQAGQTLEQANALIDEITTARDEAVEAAEVSFSSAERTETDATRAQYWGERTESILKSIRFEVSENGHLLLYMDEIVE